MPVLGRAFVCVAAAALVAVPASAQMRRSAEYQWYIGPQLGIMSFETPNQTRGGMVTAGGNILVVAKRAGLLLQVDQAFGSTQVSSYTDTDIPGGTITVNFSGVRRYEAVLVGFLSRGYIQPYVGVGLGIQEANNPRVTAPAGLNTLQLAFAEENLNELGGFAYGTLLLGMQFEVGGVTAFGQAQVNSRQPNEAGVTPNAFGRLFVGNTYNAQAGLRISLGSSRERLGAGGY